jgi:hypothetical protein
MKTAVMLVVLVVAIAVVATPARADQSGLVTEPPGATVEGPTPQPSLDVDLRVGFNSFRFSSRLFGRGGYAGGAWLNGETRKDGFSLDGRIEHGGKAHRFKLDADIDEWLRQAIRRGVIDL